jgi:competence protein ComEA
MKGIANSLLTALVCCAGLAAAQGDGKALLERTCTKCHALTSTVKQRNSPDRWAAIVDDMIARGAEGTDAEFEKIIDYLSKNFGPRVKVNKATAQEISLALEVPTATAMAIVDYRAKHGSFKSFEDLKKAPALGGKNIDDKKDRLDFASLTQP